jgi:hypothetical protein
MSTGSEDRRRFVSGLRSAAVLLEWTAGLFAAGFLLWSLTQPLRDRVLMKAVNRVFTSRGETRLIGGPIPPPGGGERLFGTWYSLVDGTRNLFVFPVMIDGILTPYAAFVDGGGKVEEVVPLSFHAEQFMPRFRRGLMGIYVRRIERHIRAEEGT